MSVFMDRGMKSDSTVFVIEGDADVCAAIKVLAQSLGTAVETYDSAQSFLDFFRPEKPGCLVVDLRLPGMGGLELLERLAAEPLKPAAIVLTASADVPSVVRAVRAGAVGFLEKPFDPEILQQHIREAVEADEQARQHYYVRREVRERYASLTPREREVLEMIITGKANKDIAAILHRSQKTIEVHRTHVMKKMRAGNVADLVRLVVTSRVTEEKPQLGIRKTRMDFPRPMTDPRGRLFAQGDRTSRAVGARVAVAAGEF
jgi:FixJ family two-component response regulator